MYKLQKEEIIVIVAALEAKATLSEFESEFLKRLKNFL
jgi:hypothetical protein